MDSRLDFRLLLEGSPDILLVLLPDAPRYTMVAATGAGWPARNSHGARHPGPRPLRSISKTIPDDPSASGTSNLRASLERVLKTPTTGQRAR